MGAADTTQARRAALLLHGLRSKDREQVMAQLSPAEVSRLQPLLAQLSELAIPRWHARQLEQLPGVELRNHEFRDLERAGRLGADAVLQALQRCSTATAAHLICAREWQWKARVLESVSDQLLIAVAECARSESGPLPPAVLESLCECLCRDAGFEEIRAEAAPGRRSAWPASRTGIGSRLRRLVGWAP